MILSLSEPDQCLEESAAVEFNVRQLQLIREDHLGGTHILIDSLVLVLPNLAWISLASLLRNSIPTSNSPSHQRNRNPASTSDDQTLTPNLFSRCGEECRPH